MFDGAVSRRAWLHGGAAALVGSLSGCVTDETSGRDDIEPPPFDSLGSAWPQVGFDAQGTAVSSDATGPRSKPTLEWEIQLAGPGTPNIVATETVLAVAGAESLHVFDLESGERAWGLDRAPASAPALDDQHLYVLEDESRLSAYPHVDDSPAWDRTLEGADTSPVVHDGTVYVGHDDGRISAVEATEGEILWQNTIGDRVRDFVTDGEYVAAHTDAGMVVRQLANRSSGWATDEFCCPIQPPTIQEGKVYSGRGDVLGSFDLPDGNQRWSREVRVIKVHAPTVGPDRVYVSKNTLAAFDTTTGKADWEADLQFTPDGPRPVVASDTAFIGGGPTSSSVGAVATKDGASRWRTRIEYPYPGNIVVVGQRLLVGSTSGRVYSFV